MNHCCSFLFLLLLLSCLSCIIPEDALPLEEWEVLAATHSGGNTLILTIDINTLYKDNTEYRMYYEEESLVNFADFISLDTSGFSLTVNSLTAVSGSHEIELIFDVLPALTGTETVLANTTTWFYRYSPAEGMFGSSLDPQAKCRFRNTLIPVN